MTEHIIVTSGWSFSDIDAVVCALLYADLLKWEGKSAEAVLPGIINNTLTQEIRSWLPPITVEPTKPATSYVVVDVSELNQIAKFVELDLVTEVYDHHFGRELFWSKLIKQRAIIEPVGACATLVWEQIKRRGYSSHLNQTQARLLYSAIISNSMNLTARITSDRDRQAAAELKMLAGLDDDWIPRYYRDQERALLRDPIATIKADTKDQWLPELNQNIVIGQIEMWDGANYIRNHAKEIELALTSFGNPDWFMTIPSINRVKNYLLVSNDSVKQLLQTAIGAKFRGNRGQTSQMYMRKEILREIARTFG